MMRQASTATDHVTPHTHDSTTAPKRRNAVVRGRKRLLRHGRRHVERLSPHPFQPSRGEKEKLGSWNRGQALRCTFHIAVHAVRPLDHPPHLPFISHRFDGPQVICYAPHNLALATASRRLNQAE